MKDASSPSDAPEGFISHETFVGLMSLTKENDFLWLDHETASFYAWVWNDDAGLSLSKKSHEWFLQLHQQYERLRNDDVPVLSPREFSWLMEYTLERLQLKIPTDSFLPERLQSLSQAQTKDLQSLWRILDERSYVYGVATILHLPPAQLQDDISCVIQAITNVIWRHDIFNL